MILVIETSSSICSIAISDLMGNLIAQESGVEVNSHAEALPQMVKKWMFEECDPKEFKAISVVKGPGSYTGLRIGTSLAKGICYAQNIPLIACNSFLGMATGAKEKYPNAGLFISMLDARRNDVYIQTFNNNLEVELDISAITLETDTLNEYHKTSVVICGNSNEKWNYLVDKFDDIVQFDTEPSAAFCIKESCEKFHKGQFENLAYFEPFYLKDFVAGISKKSI